MKETIPLTESVYRHEVMSLKRDKKAEFDAAHLTFDCSSSASVAPLLVAFMLLTVNLKKDAVHRDTDPSEAKVRSRDRHTRAHLPSQHEPSANDSRNRSMYGCRPLQG